MALGQLVIFIGTSTTTKEVNSTTLFTYLSAKYEKENQIFNEIIFNHFKQTVEEVF